MSQRVYHYPITIPFQDIDAAGVLFFAHLFRYAHEAYEKFMSDHDHALTDIIKEGECLLPLVHAKADYRKPIRHFETITIALQVKKVGKSSFTLHYHFYDDSGALRAEVETVHTALEASGHQPIPIPESLHAILVS